MKSGFVKGMKMEVTNKGSLGTYWVASIIMPCGPLLRLRYEGYGDDKSADFWSEVGSTDLHPIGWAEQSKEPLVLKPPDGNLYLS